MADDEIKALIEKRGLIKAALTRIKTAIGKFNEEVDNINQLKSRLPHLHTAFMEFTNIQDQIDLKDSANEQKHIKERDEFESKYYDVETSILTFIDKHNSSLSNSSSNQYHQSNAQFTNNVRVPQLDLPKFEGSYKNWMSFHDTFKALIHESMLYSNIEKFHYLRSCLRGEAYKAIASVSVSDTNYQVAWDVLKKRYENLRLIIQEHVVAILNSPQIQKPSYAAMRQLVDDVTINIKALEALEQPTNQWDAIVVPIIVMKFDYQTRKEWEGKLNSEIPRLSEITEFLEKKCILLESLNAANKHNQVKDNTSSIKQIKHNSNNKSVYQSTSCLTTNSKLQCYLCKGNHLLFKCTPFLQLSVPDRIKKIEELNLCRNCFRNNHRVTECTSSSCRKCNEKHNTLLHVVECSPISQSVVAHSHNLHKTNKQVLLCTAQIILKDIAGNWVNGRALLDVGSQSNFIIQSTCNKLQLPLKNIKIPITGINETSSYINQSVDIQFKSLYHSKIYHINCLVLPKITEELPTCSFSTNELQIPSNVPLADPKFNTSNKIDVLLGAGIFWSLLKAGQIPEGQFNPHLQETALGWVIGGNVQSQYKPIRSSCFLNCLENQMEQFWEIEECPNHKSTQYSCEEIECMEHFQKTHSRNSEGRFMVHLPFKQNKTQLGNSKHIAVKRLRYLDRKLTREPELKLNYSKFLQEYAELNHMNLIENNSANELDENPHCYLPHHAVIKNSSTTTKLRVVFDASAKTSSGLSLNDTLMVGPKLQDDLFAILLRFRTYQYVLSADINKMYRQILIAPNDRPFQRILWKQDNSESLLTYELNTVTYGTACAPYLAVQCLQQLASDEKQNFPIASAVLCKDFYMDDLLTGTNKFEDALQLRIELQELLLSGRFELRKWSSNEQSLLPKVDELINNSFMINLEKDSNTKLLGLWWNYKDDHLSYSVDSKVITQSNLNETKRTILSKVSQIFDPLGLLSPVIIKAKLLIQYLWQIKQNWDSPLPKDLYVNWLDILNQFNNINNLKIPRKTIEFYPTDCIQLHGFSDASEKAYGACIYIRSVDKTGQISAQLLCAKSRVAPLKVVTIPRLELCGALLLSKLMQATCESLNLNTENSFYWTDSTIVLAWLNTQPNNLKTFVANRVVTIQATSNINHWGHVKSLDNSADLITRGQSPDELIKDPLWFHGPTWLQRPQTCWSNYSLELPLQTIPEMRSLSHTVIVPECNWMNKYSNFLKLQRVTSYCLRFVHNVRNKQNRVTDELSVTDIQNATTLILKTVQNTVFSKELRALESGQEINNKSRLKSLNPFLDANGLIRVGGRLRHSRVAYNQKHPVVLPKHHITNIIIRYVHEKQLHAGAFGTLAAVRENYWPLSGRSQVRKILHKCIPCFRVNPESRSLDPMMGDLPAARFDQSRPFINSGVDYAGPILIKEGRNRKVRAYICIFVCFATRAMHLELVGDLTAESFLNALKRFVARRGMIQNIYSDNATNFVGAEKELRLLAELFQSQQFQEKCINKITTDNMKWHFIPARSPHFGGLWEAGVKRVKYHLKRVIGNASLTYEELYTVLACIEACLNSRPLTPLSNDPNDLSALTPGHFLIGNPITTAPEPSIMHLSQNRLSRWQHVEQVRQHFWKRWQTEYLGHLQQRPAKHYSAIPRLPPGTLVVLKDINAPPLVWKYGRIIEEHPGADGITRIVSVKTNNGVTKRAVRNICVVPVDE